MSEAIEIRPALSAARAHPAALAPWRYARLPQWQQKIRTPELDIEIQRYFRALVSDDRETMYTMRAAMLEGVADPDGSPYDGSAGQMVPLGISEFMIAAMYQANPLRRLCRVSRGHHMRIPRQSVRTTVEWSGEAQTITAGEPEATDFVQLRVHGLKAISTVSNEIIEDSAFSIGTWLAEDAAGAMGFEELTKMSENGNGNGQPFSIGNATSVLVSGPAWYVPTQTQIDAPGGWGDVGTLIDYDHLVKMFTTLPEEHRRNAVWWADADVLAIVMQVEEAVGFPILKWFDEAGEKIPYLLGSPLIQLPSVTGFPTVNGSQNRLYFGNLREQYFILESGEIRASVSSSGSGFTADTTQFKFVHRVDGRGVKTPTTTPAINPSYVYTARIEGAGQPV